MIKRTYLQASLFAAALAMVSGIAAAQNDAAPEPKTSPSGVTYLSGGVGDAQQQAMKEAMRDYNLHLTFARAQSGEYLANVKVVIDRAEQGAASTQVLEAAGAGPMLFVKLPPGKYRMRAELDGRVHSQALSIGSAKAQDVVVYLPAD